MDRLTLSIFDRLTGIAFTPMLVISIAAPELVSLLLGSRWVIAGEMLQWLTPSLLMAFIASPLSEVYSVLERQPEKLVFNVALFITRILSLVIGGFLGDAILAVALYSVSGTVFWALQCYWLLRISRIQPKAIFRHIGAEIVRATPFIICMGFVQYRYDSPKKLLLAAVIAILIFTVWRWKEFLGPGSTQRNAAPAS